MKLKQDLILFMTGAPSNSVGKNGDIAFVYIRGKGLYFCVKYNNKWRSRLMLDKFETLEHEINTTVKEIAVSGIIDHDDLSNVTSNQHHDAVTAGGGINVAVQQVSISYGAAVDMNDVDISGNSAGVSVDAARIDHKHDLDESITPTWTGLHTWVSGGIKLGSLVKIEFYNSSQFIRGTSVYLEIVSNGYVTMTATYLDISGKLRVDSPYSTLQDYAVSFGKESNGRFLATGGADYDENYSWIGVYNLLSTSEYDTDFGAW